LRSSAFRWYLISVKFVCPICILLIFLHQLGFI
jgi:SNF family Na+-dependent transporter